MSEDIYSKPKSLDDTFFSYAAKTIAIVGAVALAGCGGGGGGGGGGVAPSPKPPVAALSVSPNPAKRLESILLDASGSDPKDKPITECIFYANDGSGEVEVYRESTTTAPDGAFDLKTAWVPGAAQDSTIRAEVISSAGSSSATQDFDAGFGDDSNSKTDGLAYSSSVVNTLGYTSTNDQLVNLTNPSTGQPFSLRLQKAVKGGNEFYVGYYEALTAGEKADFDAWDAVMNGTPVVAMLYATESPDVIDSKLAAADSSAQALAAAKAAGAAQKIEIAQPDEDNYSDDPCEELCPVETNPVQILADTITNFFRFDFSGFRPGETVSTAFTSTADGIKSYLREVVDAAKNQGAAGYDSANAGTDSASNSTAPSPAYAASVQNPNGTSLDAVVASADLSRHAKRETPEQTGKRVSANEASNGVGDGIWYALGLAAGVIYAFWKKDDEDEKEDGQETSVPARRSGKRDAA